MRYFIFCLFILSFNGAARAADSTVFILGYNPAWLYVTKDMELTVVSSDQVSDGCWTTAQQSRNAVALELQRSGYTALVPKDNEAKGSTFYLSSIGYKQTDGTCIVSWYIELWTQQVTTMRFDKVNRVARLGRSLLWENAGVLSGPPSDMSQRVKQTFVDAAQHFLVSLVEKRQEALSAIRKSAEMSKKDEPKAHEYWSNYQLLD